MDVDSLILCSYSLSISLTQNAANLYTEEHKKCLKNLIYKYLCISTYICILEFLQLTLYFFFYYYYYFVLLNSIIIYHDISTSIDLSIGSIICKILSAGKQCCSCETEVHSPHQQLHQVSSYLMQLLMKYKWGVYQLIKYFLQALAGTLIFIAAC